MLKKQKKTCIIPLPAKAHPASLHPLVIPDITSVDVIPVGRVLN
jgi:hypothetical protein